MKKAGTARRIVREADETYFIWIHIYYDEVSGKYHRALPEFLLPFKHYIREVIRAAVNDHPDLDLYDYPSDSTRIRWKSVPGLLSLNCHLWDPGFTHKPNQSRRL